MKKTAIFTVFAFLFAIYLPAVAFSQSIWQRIDNLPMANRPAGLSEQPERFSTFRLDREHLIDRLSAAPAEFSRPMSDAVIELPMPDGSLSRFRFEHSPVAEQGLIDKYPELGATYRAYGIDDPTASARFDLLPNGFHAIILSSEGTILVDPIGEFDVYMAFAKDDLQKPDDFKCEVDGSSLEGLFGPEVFDRSASVEHTNVISGTQLRTYRLAVAATNEYANAVGGNTIAGTLAAQVLIMNRVNGVFNRELAIHMNIIANNDLIVYAGNNMSCGGMACTAASDPYTNSNGSTMLAENTTNLNNVIQSANYDIGHVFSTGGGGIATLNGPCTSSKARGVTGLPNPVGDAFAIDYVAHEMGHQWGANHTFNGTTGSCGGGRSSGSAYEPGSGVTIMGYAGICGGQNLARSSIDTFHVKSLEVIVAFSQMGNGSTCGQATATGNTPPAVSIVGGPVFDIPKQTPFTLTAAATDADGDLITYDWQQYDLGLGTSAVPNTDTDSARPIFRPFLPTTSPSRTFPALQHILANSNVPPSTYSCLGFTCLTGELLPQVGRSMTFQVVARDGRSSGGGINTASAFVVVNGSAGPFMVTSQNSAATFNGGSAQVVTWDVAGTNNLPVNTQNVKISLSTDGGQTFPMVLHASTPNDGSESIVLPNINTTTARIKVEAVGNIYFDISGANLTINAVTVPSVSLSGRVFAASGQALRSAIVTMIDSIGTRRTATSSSLGTYFFDEVPSGATYTLTVATKRYRFSPKIVNVGSADIANLDFNGLE